MTAKFRVGMNREMLTDKGELPEYDMGIQFLKGDPKIDFVPLARLEPIVGADLITDYDACLAGASKWTRATFAGAGRLLHVARWGVGYDSVDLAAATDADVMVTTTRGALDYSVAESALSFMLALAHKMLIKDRMARSGRWKERTWTLGGELREKTLGIVGVGAIGAALARMVAPFRMRRVVAFDPFLSPERARDLGVEKTDLDTLLRESDYVSIHCPKTPETTNLIDAAKLALMKPSAYLINTARGGIVNQKALYEVLKAGKIRGAGLDVFEVEPPDPKDPIFELENVIVSPHANSLTEEAWRDIGHHACRNIIKLANGGLPEYVVNPEVLNKPSFQQKLARLRARMGN